MRLIPIVSESAIDQQGHALVDTTSESEALSPIAAKQAIRTSLRASTLDGVFATIFSTITGGVLLSNFLVDLHASPTEIGLLSSIPMLANLLQPLGAWLGDRTISRHYYCLWVYAPSRLLWLLLVAGIALANWHGVDAKVLVRGTLAIVCLTHVIGALGSAAWLSWLAALVPRRLRGRYFGIRNSAASLTSLLCIPLLGFAVSAFPGNSMQSFGGLLLVGVLAGLVSLGFQYLMVDVNPQRQHEEPAVSSQQLAVRGRQSGDSSQHAVKEQQGIATSSPALAIEASHEQLKPQAPKLASFAFLQDKNFLFFLLYFSAWAFAVNLSAPFFNLYMLDNLAIDVSWVTVYNSLQAGATMVMLVVWGRLADRVGNRPILIAVGILVAVSPLLWLGIGANLLSAWLWLPLLHVLAGVTWAAIDLCNNNLQLGVAPIQQQATYFAMAAAIGGISGALGTTVGGFLAEFADYGGIPGLFVLSAIVRLGALLPLILVHEQRGQSLHQMMQVLFPSKSEPATLELAPSSLQPVILEAQMDDATHCIAPRSDTMEQ